MGCWLLFALWWVRPVVIVTLCGFYLLMGFSFHQSVPIPVSGSTWHPQIISHYFLGLSWWCFNCHSVLMLPPRLLYALGIVAPDSCSGTIRHRRRLDYLGNFLYPVGHCSSSRSKSLSIVQNYLTWLVIFPETSWFRCHCFPLRRSCWVPRVPWPYILLAQMLKWIPQTFSSRLWWVHLSLAVGIK